MKEYLLSILAAALISALLLHLLPEKASLKKGAQLLSALLLLSLVLSPLSGAKEALENLFSGDWFDETTLQEDYTKKSGESLSSYSKDYLENLVKEQLVKSFSLCEDDLSVHLLFEDGEPKKVLLLLSGKAIWQDSARLEAYVEQLLGIDCSSALE